MQAHTAFRPLVIAIAALVLVNNANPPAISAASTHRNNSELPDSDRGQLLFSQGKYDEAKKVFAAGIDKQESSPNLNQVELAKNLIGLAQVLAEERDFGPAVSQLDRAISILEKIKASQPLTNRAKELLASFRTQLNSGPVRLSPPHIISVIRKAGDNPPLIGKDPSETEFLLKSDIEYAIQHDGPRSEFALEKTVALAKFYFDGDRPIDGRNYVARVLDIFKNLNPTERQIASTQLLNLSTAALRFDLPTSDAIVSAVMSALPDNQAVAPPLTESLRSLANGFISNGNFVRGRQLLDMLLKYDRRSGVGVQGDLAQMASLEERAQHPDEAQRLWLELLSEDEKNYGVGNGKNLYVVVEVINSYLHSGKIASAEALVPNLLMCAENNGEGSQATFAQELFRVAKSFADRNDISKSTDLAIAASTNVRLDQRADDSRYVDEQLDELEKIYRQSGHVPDLESLYQAIRAKDATKLGPSNELLRAEARLVKFYLNQRQFDKAKAIADELVATHKKCPECSFRTFDEIALAFKNAGKADDALGYYGAHFEAINRDRAGDPIDLITLSCTMAELYEEKGRHADALEYLGIATTAMREKLPPDLQWLADTVKDTVITLANNSGVEDASRYIGSVGYVFMGTRKVTGSRVYELETKTAEKLEAVDVEKSITLYKKALDLITAEYGEGSVQNAAAMLNYAHALRKGGHAEEAAKLESVALPIKERVRRQAESRLPTRGMP